MEDLVFLTQEEVECQAVVDQLIQKQPESPEFGRILEPDEWICSSNLEPHRGTPWLRLNVKQYLEDLKSFFLTRQHDRRFGSLKVFRCSIQLLKQPC